MRYSYHTIKSFTEYKFKEKGSVFIGEAFPLSVSVSPEEILKEVKKKFFDATHHCYAFKNDTKTFKYSDAGEPSGTAGIRILNAIDHFNVEETLLVVIRYFGGTKLGVGPLGKAYYNAAFSTLQQAEIIEKKGYKKLQINIDISLVSFLHKMISEINGEILSSGFETNPTYQTAVPLVSEGLFIKQLYSVSKGRTEIKDTGEIFFK